jgi:conjugative transfer pilus assembly protein TraH
MAIHFRIVLTTLLMLVSAVTKADLQQELQSTFDSFVNVTPADSYSTQRRNVISGGSIVMRNKLINPNLVNFTPPSFSAGCNGIDLYGGSFSFISSAQFTQTLRNIAQAAPGYAFHLAIEGMCPTCAQVMSKLQQIANDVNSMTKNSCTAVETLFNKTGLTDSIKGVTKNLNNETSSLNTAAGSVSDWLSSIDPSTASTPTQKLAKSGSLPKVTENPVWKGLQTNSTANWFTANSNNPNQMNQVLMSLTGAPIIGPNSDNTDIAIGFREPKLHVKDFIEGGTVTVYQCESDACLLPSGNTTQINITGMRDRVRQMLYGTGTCSTCGGGVIRGFNSRDTQFSNAEKGFIQVSSPGALGLIKSVGTELGPVELISEQMIDIHARLLTYQILRDVFESVFLSISNGDSNLQGQARDQLKRVQAEMNEEMRVAGEMSQGVTNLLSQINAIRNFIKDTPDQKTIK